MDAKDLKRLATAAMFLLLLATAPNWLQTGNAKVSAYQAPWIYPGNMPNQGQ